MRGEISNTDEGQFVSASIEGSVCTSMASSYNCTVNNPLRDFSLKVTATVNQNAAELSMQHWVSTVTADTTDVRTSNNTLIVTLNFFGQQDPIVDPVDNSIETDNTSASNTSSGGGGSIDPLVLSLLAGSCVLRGVRRRD